MSTTARNLALLALLWCSCALAQAPRWTATQLEPILVADQPWEGTVVSEPTVILGADGLYRMWYTGGWADCAVGYAISKDGMTWTKYAGNPILGQWQGGIEAACHKSVFFENGIYYLYFVDAKEGVGTSLFVAASNDGINFKVTSAPIFHAPASWARNLGNTFVWREGGTYWMAVDAQGYDYIWRAGPATSQSPSGPFTFLNLTWPSLCLPGSYGHVHVIPHQGSYDAWYLCAPSGTLPTDIWHAKAVTLTGQWAWKRDAKALISHSGTGWMFDQAADPSLAPGPNGTMFLYHSGMNNAAPSGAIGLAVLIP